MVTKVGWDGTCLAPDALKLVAWDACQAQSLTLTNVLPIGECDQGGYQGAEVTCCGG